MTGEMSKSEVTRENFPIYFAAADTIHGATVEPFDQYQGPYIFVPSRGRFFLDTEDGMIGRWWSERDDELGPEMWLNGDMADTEAANGFADLFEHGGTPVERNDP